MNNYTKLRKDELIERLVAAENRPATTWADVPALLQRTVSVVSRELPLFVKDCQRLWAFGRRCCMMVFETYRQPILRKQGT